MRAIITLGFAAAVAFTAFPVETWTVIYAVYGKPVNCLESSGPAVACLRHNMKVMDK